MIKGKLVVVSNLTTFKTIQQSSDPIPDSAIVFIKNEGQIWTKGSYFGVQKTYDVVSKTDVGLAPKGGDSASSLIANVDDEWVLTVTNGSNPSWRKLPANAFKNQTYTFYNLAFKNSSGTTVDRYKPTTSPSKSVNAGTNVEISANSNTITISATDTTYNSFTGASDSTDGSLGLVPKPTKGNQSKFLKADGSWATPTDTTYPVVTSTKDGLVPKFDANDGTIDQLDKDWVLTNNNGSIGWYKLPTNAFNNSTYSLVNNSSNGLVPILPTTNSTTISTQADEWVLTTTKGGEPSWRKLPTTAFYSLPTAKTNALGGIKVGSVSTSAFADLTGKYYTVNVDKNGVAYVDVPWTDTPYTLPKASSTLGGVKTTSIITSTSGLTACPIIDGVVYYKDSDSNTWRGIYVGGTSKMGTANNTKALNFAAGNNVTISYAAPGTASGQSGNANYGTLTINATNTWTAWAGATSSANGTAGYMPAPTSALRNQFLRGDGTWQSLNNYSLPTASSSTLGGVKTGEAITDTTGYTPVHIKDGVIYYKGSSTGCFDDKLTVNYNNKGTDTYALVINRNNYGDTLGIFNTANANDLFIRGSVSFPNRSDANGGNDGMGWHVFPASSLYTNVLGNNKSSYNINTGSVTFGGWNDTAMPLYIDITNKRVGIGTVNPSASFKLHVAGSAGITGSLLFIRLATTYLLADITTTDNTGFQFEAPRATNSAAGSYLPYTFAWRGGWSAYHGIQFIRETGGTHIHIKSLDSAMKLFAWGGATYIQSGTKDFSGNYPLYITGPSSNQGSDLWLNFSNIMCGSNKYTLYHSGNHRFAGGLVYNIEGTDFAPNSKDGTYIGMSTLTGIETNWRHVVSMNWSQAGDTAGNATWCSLLSLPTLNRKGIYYRSATGESSWGPWVKLLDTTDSVGGSSFDGKWTGTLRIDGSNSRGNYPSVKWHISNVNWAQILMNDSGELEFRGGGSLDAGYSNVRMGILVCTSLQINGSTLTFVT